MGWREADHPRDRRGRFAEKAGGGWAGRVVDAIRGGSRYKRVEGRDLTDEVVAQAGRYGAIYIDPNKHGDEILGDIARRQGFDGLPTVGTAAELDEAVAEGGIELWRGVRGNLPKRIGYGDEEGQIHYPPNWRASEMHEQWRSGEYKAGDGLYGQGTYTSVDRRAAEHYGMQMTDQHGGKVAGEDGEPLTDPRTIVRMVLSPDARVFDWGSPGLTAKIKARLDREITPESVRREAAEALAAEDGLDVEDLDDYEIVVHADDVADKAAARLRDVGRAAAMLGYDAVRIRRRSLYGDGTKYDVEQYNILNRTAVLVEEAYDENLLPPEVIRTWETRRDLE
jgi:hypothetical protein